MKTIINKKCLFLLLFTVLLAGCKNEIINSDEYISNEISNPQVKEGRLYFPNKASLQHHYDLIKDASDEEIANFVDKLDYIPLRPILTEKNERIVAEKLKIRIQKFREQQNFTTQTSRNTQLVSDDEIIDDIDDLEEIIGDDAYGAFLNENAEIQVANDIYKYTDVGLFIVSEDHYETLNPYLASKNISNQLLVSTPLESKMQYIATQPCLEVTPVENEISYFNDYDCGGGGGGGSGSGSSGSTSYSVNIDNFVRNLSVCNPNGSLIPVFGKANICKDRYERRRRVKTKAFNYNYLLVYHLGVKVKHQYRGVTRIWRKENCEEIRLGIINGTYFYDYTQYAQPLNTNITTIYNNNQRIMFDAGIVNWNQNGLQITGYSINNFPNIIKDNIVIEQFSNNELINQAINSGNRQLTAKRLSKYFWESTIPNVEKWWNKLGKDENPGDKPNNITYIYKKLDPTNPGKILINKTLFRKKTNTSKVSKTFDWGFEIGFNINPDNGNISTNMSSSALKRPQNFEILMYGIAKRNGVWHGSKIDTRTN